MIPLTAHWLFELFGRLHPLLVHFPVGLLIGALLLEGWNRFRKGNKDYSGLIYLGALSAVLAALMGAALKSSGEYAGSLVNQHQWTGYVTAVLALGTAFVYWKQQKLPKALPFWSLIITCLGTSVAGHLGASLTHGEDYLSEVLPWNKPSPVDAALLQSFAALAAADSFPQDQLDRLNLEVRAVFAHNCYQCHSTAKRKGDLALDHEEGVFAGGENGPVIKVGDAQASELVKRLKLPRSHDDAMPPKGKTLQAEEIALIELWIDQGAPWADADLKVFREAPLELVQPEIPDGPKALSHPVDRFANVYFEEQGINWPEPVDDRQFIRRAYLDVIGLLPKPEDIQAFIDDNNSNKREQLIDQLLQDKTNYAQHWLSFWNDLLRNDYSGTGYITGGRKQITEWLYQALIEEKPYDQMVAELINPGPEAEGFIKGIQWRGEVNASQRTELQAAQNISQSLLGLNLKCASCHNSFINNLTLDQAYGFANIFATEPMEIYRCDKPTGRIAKTAFLYPELGEVVSDSLKDRLKELVEVMVQPENGRLYRTIVNRYWDRLLGRGIVAPVDEMDNIPWSQDLLDWLAADFIDNGYDFHHLLRQIMTSRVYQLPAVPYPSPEYLTSETFVFRGPAVRRLTAEQFVDALSQVVGPVYHGLAFDPQGRESDAEWIWHEEIELERRVLPKPGKRYFRKTFQIQQLQQISKAEILVTADHSFTIHLNGRQLASDSNWQTVNHILIPEKTLAEENIIAIEGVNEGIIPNPAGLLFSLRIQFADSTEQFVHSDRSWKSSADTLAYEWTSLYYDDQPWDQAWRAGSFENSFWGVLPAFSFDREPSSAEQVRAAMVRQDNFMKTLGRPVRENVVTQRDAEATLLQSLLLTNGEVFHNDIAEGASIWLEQYEDQPETLIDTLYLNALGRLPERKERKLLVRKLKEGSKKETLQDIIWALVLLPEFQLI